MRVFLTIFCFAACCGQATAAAWLDLGKSSDNNLQVFIDLESIKPYTKRIPLQTRSSNSYASGFIQHTYINSHENRKKGWYYSKAFYIVDCDNKSFYNPSYITYGFKDEVVDTSKNNNFTLRDFNMAFPDTIGENIVDAICDVAY